MEVDYVVHLAAKATFGNGKEYEQVNYYPTQVLVRILKKSLVLKKIVFTSTIGAIDRHASDRCVKPITVKSQPSPTSDYGSSKLKAEQNIIISGLPYLIIRPTWVYGKNMRRDSHINVFLSMIYKKAVPIYFRFLGKVSLIHVEDLAKSLVNSLLSEIAVNKIYFAETEAITIGEIFRTLFEKVYSKKLKQIPILKWRYFWGRIHSLIPIKISNLFLDYLYAEDRDFRQELLANVSTKKFIHDVDDIISSNIYNTGRWVITGSNSGIGLALARLLVKKGKKLILIDKDLDHLEEFNNQIVIQADLTSPNELLKVVKTISEYKVYCLVNNAGIGFRKSFNDLTLAEIEEVMKINMYAPIFLTKSLLRDLIEEGSIIVNLSSSVAFNPLPNMLMYSATKSFISNWSESLSYELRKTNLVLTFSPSGTLTNFQKQAGVKVFNHGKGLKCPNMVAIEIIEAINKSMTVKIHGRKTLVLLWFSRLLPRGINIKFWGMMFSKIR